MRLLCIRFSAIGDVAMTVPIVKACAIEHQDIQFVVASRPFAKAFYEGLMPNIEFASFDLKDARYRGIMGMEHVYQDLRALKPDMVADLHDVLRTKYARLRFRLAGIPVASINKHRELRKAIVSQKDKQLTPQLTSFQKYAEVFQSLGIQFPLSADAPLSFDGVDRSVPELANAVGIAPFAAHKGKIYPIEKTEEVIRLLMQNRPQLQIILFGGGPKETKVFSTWAEKYPNVRYAGDICSSMREELQLMQQMRCMLTMDSGNMHMASLVGTPVVSVWGATHPYAGFMGWGQSMDNVIQTDLPCRPCSIYGNKPCLRQDYACLNAITPQQIAQKMLSIIP